MSKTISVLQEARQSIPEECEICLREYLEISNNTADWCDLAMSLYHLGFVRGRQYEQSNGRETAV